MVKQTIMKFDETDWTRMKKLQDIQEKYDLMIYEQQSSSTFHFIK